MATLTKEADSSYGWIRGADLTYSTARSTSGSSNTSNLNNIGQNTVFVVRRAYLRFDTSPIPNGATINSVNLRMVVSSDGSNTDFNMHVAQYDWSSPITASETDYDGALAAAVSESYLWRSTVGIAVDTQYESADLNTTWVDKEGFTYLVVISEEDINDSEPTDTEMLTFYAPDDVTASNRPALIVDYEGGGVLLIPWH